MKKENTLSQRLTLTLARIFSIAVLSAMLYFDFHIPYKELLLLFSHSDHFWFSGRHIALCSFAPACIFTIIYMAITLFFIDYEPSNKMTYCVNIFGLISLVIFILINAFSIIFYLYIGISSPYKQCQEPTLKNYYVTDYSICEHLEKSLFY